MTVQAHADAILGLLRADAGLTVYPVESGAAGSAEGIVPQGATPPYVAVHLYLERPLGEGSGGEALNGATTRAVMRAYCHCVGATDIAARAVSQRVATRLLDARPVVTGRKVFPIRYDFGQPARNDESTGTLVSELTDVYRLESIPA